MLSENAPDEGEQGIFARKYPDSNLGRYASDLHFFLYKLTAETDTHHKDCRPANGEIVFNIPDADSIYRYSGEKEDEYRFVREVLEAAGLGTLGVVFDEKKANADGFYLKISYEDLMQHGALFYKAYEAFDHQLTLISWRRDPEKIQKATEASREAIQNYLRLLQKERSGLIAPVEPGSNPRALSVYNDLLKLFEGGVTLRRCAYRQGYVEMIPVVKAEGDLDDGQDILELRETLWDEKVSLSVEREYSSLNYEIIHSFFFQSFLGCLLGAEIVHNPQNRPHFLLEEQLLTSHAPFIGVAIESFRKKLNREREIWGNFTSKQANSLANHTMRRDVANYTERFDYQVKADRDLPGEGKLTEEFNAPVLSMRAQLKAFFMRWSKDRARNHQPGNHNDLT